MVFEMRLGPTIEKTPQKRPVSKGERTRERILDLAEEAVLRKGFAATSIEELVAAAKITKSGFLYHFKDKSELAKALLERYLERDGDILDSIFERADALNEDPLHGFLVALAFFAEMMDDLPGAHPGCLAASFAYQDQLFSSEIRELNASGILAWRNRFRDRLEAIAAKYPPKIDVDLDALADMTAVVVDGGIMVSRALGEPKILPAQILLLRNFMREIFQP